MIAALDELRKELSVCKLDDSLVFLNHVLAVSRQLVNDPQSDFRLDTSNARIPPFLVHFFAKQLLLNSEESAKNQLDVPTLRRLGSLYFAINDPIVGDPAWKASDPSGFFERLFAQQLTAQERLPIRDYGLALALFRDAGTPRSAADYDLRGEIEREIGLPIETFMRFGQACLSFQATNWNQYRLSGTFTSMYLAEAFCTGFDFCVPEVWTPALERLACDPLKFRQVAARPDYAVEDERYILYGFNPLYQFPITNLGHDRYIAVDPWMIAYRVTWGLFFDLFEKQRVKFSERFGEVFDRLVGQMLGSVCPAESLWSHTEWKRQSSKKKPPKGKCGDWAVRFDDRLVLIECKSLRPSIRLMTYGLDEDVEESVKKIAKALSQILEHGQAILNGKWQSAGIPPLPSITVLITYGHMRSASLPFFRKRVLDQLKELGFPNAHFAILSLEEFDSVIRLAEVGVPLSATCARLAEGRNLRELLVESDAAMMHRVVSTFAFSKGKEFLDSVVHRPTAAIVRN